MVVGKQGGGPDPVGELIALLQETGEGMARLAQDMAETARSHPTDMTAVSVLSRHPAPLTVGELGREMGLSKAATTALVDRLERAGHVHRVRDTRDRRRWHLRVTDSAHALAESVLRDFLDHTRAALAHYDPGELAVARRFLTDVRDALGPHGDVSGRR